ncbi:MAG: GNAT family N-acetyltransferase [Bacteroidota bacterium]
MITYQLEPHLSVAEFREILIHSTLGERRPVDEPDRLEGMLQHANLILTAREEGKIVGVSRAWTDFVYCTYLSDLAVDQAYQKQGIGKALIQRTREQAPQATLILLAAPAAEAYYPRIGMHQHAHCYYLKSEDELL